MNKPRNGSGDYSRNREFTAILQDLRSQFQVFGERLGTLCEDVDILKEDVATLKFDVSVIKSIIPTLATKKELAL
jgi:hypothetical protein